MEELDFLVIIKSAVWQISKVCVYCCKQFVRYLVKGWWIILACIGIPLAIVAAIYFFAPTRYSVRTELMFCGLNTPDFVQECENIIKTQTNVVEQEFVEIVDCYNDSIPDKINWLYSTPHADEQHRLLADRTYFIYVTTNEEDKLEYLHTLQNYFRQSPNYQTRYQLEYQLMTEESRVLHAQVNALEKSFENGFTGNEYMPSIKHLYKEMTYIDSKLYACTEPISISGATMILSATQKACFKAAIYIVILGLFFGLFLSIIWVNRKKLLKK